MNREQQRFELAKAYSLKLMDDPNMSSNDIARGAAFLATRVLEELDRTKPEPGTPQPDADGWIPHRPGDPAPCKDGTKVFVKYADGYYSNHYTNSRETTWELFNRPMLDVIAWKPA